MMRAVLTESMNRWANRWLFQMRGAESGDVFLNQRRVFILPTRAGLMFGVTLVLLFIGAVNYTLSLGFALTFLLGACAVIDMHMTFRNLAHLTLSPGKASPVFAGDAAQFELHLINRRKHARYAIWLGFTGRDASDLDQPVDIDALSSTTATLSIPAIERGWLSAPRVRLQTRFPLGLMRAWSFWQPALQVLVYPKPEMEGPPLPLHDNPSSDGTGAAGHDDFAGIRSYQPGDSLKHLAWRQIARLQSGLVTKHFEGGAASELFIDYNRLPRTLDVERKLSRMARWVIDAETRGLPYAFRLGNASFEPAVGPAHRNACLQALALYDGI